MRPAFLVALLFSFTGHCLSQTPESLIHTLTGQQLLFPHFGDHSKVKLKTSQLSRLKGSCDVAVLVRSAEWKTGTALFRMETIGLPSIMNKRQNSCSTLSDETILEISGFAIDEPRDSLLASIRRVLQTPEEYLEYKGAPFTIPPGPEDETPVKPPPPITHPTPVLGVDGAYTHQARARRLKGTVSMRLVIGTDGRPHKIRILKGIGLGLDEGAMRALSLWRFQPAQQQGKAVAVESTIEMHFEIM